ncbi:MAG: trehalose 6-phosphate phosphorylase, partial [Bacteroidetes bacterium SW_10_40_5]
MEFMSNLKFQYSNYNADQQPLREALLTLGNGYFATRAAFEAQKAGSNHYPGTYLGGGYNRLESEIQGKIIENEDLVNWPNWLDLTFKPESEKWLDLDDCRIHDFNHQLDLEKGVLSRYVRF